MKTLYIHIGTPKTGTSSIQQFCIRNRKVLNSKGYEYPIMPFRYTDIGKERNGCFLTVATRGDTPGEVEEHTRFFTEGLGILREKFKIYDSVILSDEGLWSVLGDRLEEFWEPLLSHAAEIGYAIKIIVYLRRQDKLAASRYNQMIKSAERNLSTITPEEWLQGLGTGRMDYYGTLERAAAHAGKENIDVHIYDRKQIEKDGGNIFSDFLGSVGLTLDSSFEMPSHDENSDTLGLNFLALKRAVNGLPGHSRDNGIDKNFRRAATECSRVCKGLSGYSLFSPQEARSLLESLEEGNTNIAREYLHREGPLFDTYIEETKKWTEGNPQMLDDTVCYFRQLAIFQNETIAKASDDVSEENNLSEWIISHSDFESTVPAYERTVKCIGSFFLERELSFSSGRAVSPVDPEKTAAMARMLYLTDRAQQIRRAVRRMDRQGGAPSESSQNSSHFPKNIIDFFRR